LFLSSKPPQPYFIKKIELGKVLFGLVKVGEDLNLIESVSKSLDSRRRRCVAGHRVSDPPSPHLPITTTRRAPLPALGCCRPGAAPLSLGPDPPPPPNHHHLTAWHLPLTGPRPPLPLRHDPLNGRHPSSPPLRPDLHLSCSERTVSAPSHPSPLHLVHRRSLESRRLASFEAERAITSATLMSAAPRQSFACFLRASPPPPTPLAPGPHRRGAPPLEHRCCKETPPLLSRPPPCRWQGNPVSSTPYHLARHYPRAAPVP
jgi:hypothetical protein